MTYSIPPPMTQLRAVESPCHPGHFLVHRDAVSGSWVGPDTPQPFQCVICGAGFSLEYIHANQPRPMAGEADYRNYVQGRANRLVYVACPMRLGNPWANVRRAMEITMGLLRAGWTPICPALSAFWETAVGPISPGHPDGASGWLDYDFRVVARCDGVIRISGESSGADREVALARHLGIPVLTPEEALDRARAGTYLDDLGERNVV